MLLLCPILIQCFDTLEMRTLDIRLHVLAHHGNHQVELSQVSCRFYELDDGLMRTKPMASTKAKPRIA